MIDQTSHHRSIHVHWIIRGFRFLQSFMTIILILDKQQHKINYKTT